MPMVGAKGAPHPLRTTQMKRPRHYPSKRRQNHIADLEQLELPFEKSVFEELPDGCVVRRPLGNGR
jgi:hypothetical protein